MSPERAKRASLLCGIAGAAVMAEVAAKPPLSAMTAADAHTRRSLQGSDFPRFFAETAENFRGFYSSDKFSAVFTAQTNFPRFYFPPPRKKRKDSRAGRPGPGSEEGRKNKVKESEKKRQEKRATE